jgi:hypothetical protein
MDQNFVNEYIQQLASQSKNLLMEKMLLATHHALLSKQVEELKKQVEELKGKLDSSTFSTPQ